MGELIKSKRQLKYCKFDWEFAGYVVSAKESKMTYIYYYGYDIIEWLYCRIIFVNKLC